VPELPSAGRAPEGSRYVDGDQGLCTAACETNDDCERVPESPCRTGFTCAIPVTVGPFCCRKMCMCKDYLAIPGGGLPTPATCEPTEVDRAACPHL